MSQRRAQDVLESISSVERTCRDVRARIRLRPNAAACDVLAASLKGAIRDLNNALVVVEATHNELELAPVVPATYKRYAIVSAFGFGYLTETSVDLGLGAEQPELRPCVSFVPTRHTPGVLTFTRRREAEEIVRLCGEVTVEEFDVPVPTPIVVAGE
jgi:hypothetical protein